jgi:Domain of unknown function (DUF4922)
LRRSNLLNLRVYAIFDGKERANGLPGLCLDFLAEQKKAWPDLLKGYELLQDVRERHLPCRGFSVRLQHNPGRIRSSTAEVGRKEGNGRRCFLCLDHLPEGQKGILHRDEYLILCNPMPVFSPHFTISHLDHRRQAITEQINTFLQLMADFGSGWTVLYNGPRCGASAPDHLHFQVVPSGQMPIEKEILEKKRLALLTPVGDCLLYRVKDLGREVVVLEGDDLTAMGSAFNRFLESLRTVLSIEEEPMMNIAGFHRKEKGEKGKGCLVIFPRRKHRPDSFFREENARVVVSPGAIDMGGVLITPVKKDFERLDAASVEGIYEEVSLEGRTVERAIYESGR